MQVLDKLASTVLHPDTHYIVLDPAKMDSVAYSRLTLKEVVSGTVKEHFKEAGVLEAYYHHQVQLVLDGWYRCIEVQSDKPDSKSFTTRYADGARYCGIITGDKALYPIREMDVRTRYLLHDHVFDVVSKRLGEEEPLQYSDGDVSLILFQLQKTDTV